MFKSDPALGALEWPIIALTHGEGERETGERVEEPVARFEPSQTVVYRSRERGDI